MKALLRLSLAVLLVSSALARVTISDFVANNDIKSLAPHLIQDINTKGIETFDSQDAQTLLPNSNIPLLDDIVQIVSLSIFTPGAMDWSSLEKARLQLTKDQGSDVLSVYSKFSELDTRRAAMVVNTIYDTVINLVSTQNKDSIEVVNTKGPADTTKTATSSEQVNAQEPAKAEAPQGEQPKAEGAANPIQSKIWEFLGLGLITSSNTVKKAKGIVVAPAQICETTNTDYLKRVDDLVYFSSMTHGLANGVILSEPVELLIQSSEELRTILASIGKLAIDLQLSQNIARVAELNPKDTVVRTMTYLALAAESVDSPMAQMARDLNNLIRAGHAEEIPETILKSLQDEAAMILVTKGAGAKTGHSFLESIPLLRNVMTFSSEVLNANNIGDVLKYIFCPESSGSVKPADKTAEKDANKKESVEKPSEKEAAPEPVNEAVPEAAKAAPESPQKVLQIPEEAREATPQEKEKDATKIVQADVDPSKDKEAKETKENVDANAATDAGTKIPDKAAEGATDKVNKKVIEDTKSESESMAKDTDQTTEKKQEDQKEKADEKDKSDEKAAEKTNERPNEARNEL
ncbi:hypothetical protein BGW38_005494 [Lunasporangiospora selenospora]|uniref:Uncharacterized protein n=1 Tax=Lunasporangiospora selenospora TaxID=979761 RepID=A0A9P6KBB1_9FUNG|nr:hypothetical protein BGW38_005494 [Lunasporangiospora selenospora]